MTGPTAPKAQRRGVPAGVLLRNFGDLLGEKKSRVVLLAAASTLSGLTEAGVLAIVAKTASVLATKSRHVDVYVGPISFRGSLAAFLVVGGVLACARLLLQVPIVYLPPRIVTDAQALLRRQLFDAFTHAGWDVQARDREGHLQELLGSQVIQASQASAQAAKLVTNGSAFAIMLAAALALNPAAAGVVIGISVVFFAAERPLTTAGVRYARTSRDAQLVHAAGVSEAARLAESTQVFGVAAVQRARFNVLVERVRLHTFRAQLLNTAAGSIYPSLVFLLLVGGLAVVYRAGFGNFATLGAVVLLLIRAAGYGNLIQNAYQNVRQGIPFVEQIRAEEQRYRSSTPVRGPRPLESVERLTFEEVGFTYRAGSPVLENVSFEIRNGEAIGIVGPSGAGKSTLAQILLRLRSPTSGRYLVNGESADAFRDEDWHRTVAYIPQTPQLIHASVAENIRYLRDFSDADVERAARLSGIHEEVLEWADGYDTIVGPRADAVSGGQAQRICLARALVGRPAVLLLDEPTSAVDPRSEGLIRETLRSLKGDVLLLVIAHRLSTLDMCDRVLVLVDGRVDAFGAVETLRASNPYYHSLLAAPAPEESVPASPGRRAS